MRSRYMGAWLGCMGLLGIYTIVSEEAPHEMERVPASSATANADVLSMDAWMPFFNFAKETLCPSPKTWPTKIELQKKIPTELPEWRLFNFRQDPSEMVLELSRAAFEGRQALTLRISKNIDQANQSEKAFAFSVHESRSDQPSVPVFSVDMNLKCRVLQAGIWEYTSDGRLRRRAFAEEDGILKLQFWVNPRVKDLKEIYSDPTQLPDGFRNLNDILNYAANIASRTTLVAVLDSGVDYNDPKIAYRIPRPLLSNENARKDYDEANAVMANQENLKSEMAKSAVIEVDTAALLRRHESSPTRALVGKWIDRVNETDRQLAKTHDEAQKRRLEILNQLTLMQERIQKIPAIGWDFGDKDAEPYDYVFNREWADRGVFWHGTSVASVILQNDRNVSILPVRIVGAGPESIPAAVEYAYARGARILNLSMFDSRPEAWDPNFKNALEKFPDMLFVVSSGNRPWDIDERPLYPASFDNENLLVVGAVDAEGVRQSKAKFSSEGRNSVDFFAPGVDIPTWRPEGQSVQSSGTSFSAPLAAVAAAKVKRKHPAWTPKQIIDFLGAHLCADPSGQLRNISRFGGVLCLSQIDEALR